MSLISKSLKLSICLFFLLAGYSFAYDEGENRDPYVTYSCDEITGDCVGVTDNGELKISVETMELSAQTPFLLRVAKGEIPGHSIVSKFGQNLDVDSGLYEDIWEGGGTYPYPANGVASITHL